MKNLNKINKIMISITIALVGIFIYKVVSYKQWERYYYISEVSNPEEFPINIQGIWFILPNGDFGSPSFYKSHDRVDNFYSDWGVSEYDNADEPELLPKSLFLEYIDFRTRNYYIDTILLPKEKMIEVFMEAKANNYLKNLSSWNPKMGLEFHVGIANDGNIIFWLIGNKYEKEFYRIQLKPKVFPKKMEAFPDQKEIYNKEEYINKLFEKIPDSIQLKILKQDVSNIQYKDSIPIYFDNLQK